MRRSEGKSVPAAPGWALVLFGALAFAGANAAAKGLYMRGCTLVTVFLIRTALVSAFNGVLVAIRQGCAAAAGVLMLRTGRPRRWTTALCVVRGATGAATGILLNLSFYFLTLADAFTIFVAVGTLGTVLLGRAALGVSEGLSRRELLTGTIALLAVAIIARGRGASDVAGAAAPSPPAFTEAGVHFGPAPSPPPAWPASDSVLQPKPVSTAELNSTAEPSSTGVLPAALADGAPQAEPDAASSVSVVGWSICVMGGVASAGFNLFTRHLSRPDGPHGVPPPVLLAYFMAVVLFVVGLFSSIARATNLDGQPGWEWARVQPPAGVEEWGLILVYCAGVLSGQLAMAAGYARVRAGKAAFIALSELAFAYVLDVTVLREPSSLVLAAGTALVFCSVSALVQQPQPAGAATLPHQSGGTPSAEWMSRSEAEGEIGAVTESDDVPLTSASAATIVDERELANKVAY